MPTNTVSPVLLPSGFTGWLGHFLPSSVYYFPQEPGNLPLPPLPTPFLNLVENETCFYTCFCFSRLLVEVVQGFLFLPPFLFFLLSNYNFICVVRTCVCMWVHVPWCVSRGQSTTRVIRFSPSTMWVLRIRLTLTGSVANAAIP